MKYNWGVDGGERIDLGGKHQVAYSVARFRSSIFRSAFFLIGLIIRRPLFRLNGSGLFGR